jgi:hypothetical protein
MKKAAHQRLKVIVLGSTGMMGSMLTLMQYSLWLNQSLRNSCAKLITLLTV